LHNGSNSAHSAARNKSKFINGLPPKEHLTATFLYLERIHYTTTGF